MLQTGKLSTSRCHAVHLLYVVVALGFIWICLQLRLLSVYQYALQPLLSASNPAVVTMVDEHSSEQAYALSNNSSSKLQCKGGKIGERVSLETAAAKMKQWRDGKNVTKYVIVTGAAGFIGSHVAKHCASLGLNVVAIDDLSGGFVSNVPLSSKYNVVFERGSVHNDSFIDYVFTTYGDAAKGRQIEYVYHLAAYAAEGLSHFIRRFNFENNLMSSTLLINYAVNYKVKCFVFTSSIAMYGSGPHHAFTGKFSEDLAGNPEDPYGISKYAVEMDLKSAHQMFGLNSVIFRPHNVYGPKQNMFDKYRNVIGIFLYNLLHNEPMRVFGDGQQTRSFSYIDDVAPYIALAPLFPHLANQRFNIGAQRPYSLNALCKLVIKAFISNADIQHVVHKYHNLSIMHEYHKLNKVKKMNMNMNAVIDALFANHKIVQHIEQRNEVVNAEAAHDFFHCMFQIEQSEVVELERGLNQTLQWVLSTHFNLSQQAAKSNAFYPINFQSVEIAQNLPKSWADGVKHATNNGHIPISKMAQIVNSKPPQSDIDANEVHVHSSKYIDGSKGKSFPIDHANWGKTYNLSVWCAIIVKEHNDPKLAAIEQTWGSHCNKLLYVFDAKTDELTKNFTALSTAKNVEFVPIHTKVADGKVVGGEGRDLWEKMWKLYVYLDTKHRNEFDYLLRADTDTWFSVPNFKAYATYFNPQQMWYMGHTELHYARTPFQAGGNYALSHATIHKLVQQVFNTTDFLQSKSRSYCKADTVGWAEDMFLAQCLQRINVWPLNTLNEKHQLRWSPMSYKGTKASNIKFPTKPSEEWWYFTNRFEIYPEGDECCDEHMISVHHMKSKDANALAKWFQKLDKVFAMNETQPTKQPPPPTTFLFGKSMKWTHEQITIDLE